MAIEDYSGREGYQRMVQELRTMLAREFPERADDIFIVDMLAPREEQVAQAAAQLGMTPEELIERGRAADYLDAEEFPDINNGIAYAVTREDGTTAWVLFSWNPLSEARGMLIREGQDPETITDEMVEARLEQFTGQDILALAKVILHETSHALSLGDNPSYMYGKNYGDTMGRRRVEESQAEVVSIATLVASGADQAEAEWQAAVYDYRKYDPYHPATRFDIYDPADGYMYMRDSYLAGLPRREFTRYDELTGFRDIMERSLAYSEANQPTERESAERIAYYRSLLNTVGILRESGMSEDDIAQWVIDRQAFILDGAQVESARAYLANPEGPYVPAEPAVGSYTQSVGRAMLAAMDNPGDAALNSYAYWMIAELGDMLQNGLCPELSEAGLSWYAIQKMQDGLDEHDERWRPIAEMLARGEDPQLIADTMLALEATDAGQWLIEELQEKSAEGRLPDVNGNGFDNEDIRAWLADNGIDPEVAAAFDYTDGMTLGEVAAMGTARINEFDKPKEPDEPSR